MKRLMLSLFALAILAGTGFGANSLRALGAASACCNPPQNCCPKEACCSGGQYCPMRMHHHS